MSRRALRGRWPRGVYYTVALTLLGLVAGSAGAQIELTIDPVMVRGPADAPVTIIEFSDYQ